MTHYLFDSHPLLKFFQRENGHEEVGQLLERAGDDGRRPILSIINFAEIIYLVKKRFGDREKMRVIAAIHTLDFSIISATDDLVYEAAELKGKYPLSFADCFALATALRHKATLVTGDPEFRSVGGLVKIRWV